MKKLLLFTATITLLSSCGNEVEEITDPSTGTVLTRYEYYTDDNGQKVKDGEYTEWKKDGSLQKKENYKDGKLEGESIYYQSQDSVYFNYYKEGRKEGVCRLENGKGLVLSSFSYKNDALNGETVYNYLNGKPYIKAKYESGLPTGTWKYYDETGKETGTLTFNENYVPKELIGAWWIKDMRLTYFEFKEDGYVGYWAPFNKFSLEPFEQMSGNFTVGRHLRLQFGTQSHGKLFGFDIKSIGKKKIVLLNKGDGSEFILEKLEL
jgi:antitoxin component YwqK of YwqJK toxin-antitoxin module